MAIIQTDEAPPTDRAVIWRTSRLQSEIKTFSCSVPIPKIQTMKIEQEVNYKFLFS
jgi:hypothetical protein